MIKAGVFDVGLCHARALKDEGYGDNRGVACCASPMRLPSQQHSSPKIYYRKYEMARNASVWTQPTSHGGLAGKTLKQVEIAIFIARAIVDARGRALDALDDIPKRNVAKR